MVRGALLFVLDIEKAPDKRPGPFYGSGAAHSAGQGLAVHRAGQGGLALAHIGHGAVAGHGGQVLPMLHTGVEEVPLTFIWKEG